MTESTHPPTQLHTPQAGLLGANPSNIAGVAKQLSPYKKLKVVSSKFFVRSIHANIQRIKDSRRPVRLKLRNNCSVVVIDNQTYEELLNVKAKLIEAVERMQQSDAANLDNS